MKSDFLQNETYKFIYSAMRYDNALIMRTCLETGLRVGDVVSLPREALQGNTIYYTASKTGKPGKAHISADLALRLRRDYGRWLFPSPHDLSKHRTRQAVWRDMRKACAHLGLTEHATPHSARKTFAVDLYHKQGLPAVQKALQHDRIDTTMIYAFSDVLNAKSAPNRAILAQNEIDLEALAELIAEKVAKKLRDSS